MTDPEPTEVPLAPSLPARVSVIARTDGEGAVLTQVSATGAALGRGHALSIDVALAALERLGAVRGAGALRSTLLSFDDEVVAVGRDAAGGAVIVIGGADATPGLLLAHVHRLLAEAPPSRGAP
jgi:hypothetical protein